MVTIAVKMERRFADDVFVTKGRDGAPNVPNAHSVERLTEQHEATPDLHLILRSSGKRAGPDPARWRVNQGDFASLRPRVQRLEVI